MTMDSLGSDNVFIVIIVDGGSSEEKGRIYNFDVFFNCCSHPQDESCHPLFYEQLCWNFFPVSLHLVDVVS